MVRLEDIPIEFGWNFKVRHASCFNGKRNKVHQFLVLGGIEERRSAFGLLWCDRLFDNVLYLSEANLEMVGNALVGPLEVFEGMNLEALITTQIGLPSHPAV